jgi:hypothetical protein
MHNMGWKALGVLTVAVAMLAGDNASAEPINATFGYVPIGSTTFTPPGNIGTATSVTIPASEIVNTIPTTFLGKPNDFFSGPASFSLGNSVTVSPLTLSPMFVNDGMFHPEVLPAYLTIASGSTPANRFVFDMSSIRWASSGPQELDFAALGTLHDTAGVFMDQSADISGSFTQTTQGGSVNASFTFETPGTITATAVPEPASLTLLGIGVTSLIGYGIRRKRQAA